MKIRILGGFSLLVFFFGITAEGRPEYAVRHNNISCTSCHYSPVGGGALNFEGKKFQTRWFKTNPLEIQKYISSQFIGLGYLPEKSKTSSSGLGLMAGLFSAHVPLSTKENTFLVIETNVAGFSTAPLRDTYFLYKFNPEKIYNWFDTVLVGRFRAPFGLITNEHRTYTKIQTGTRWFDFETGFMLSGNPTSQTHYDLALVNGKNFSGDGLNTGQAHAWGTILNFRYMPSFFQVGSSYSHYKVPLTESSYSWSTYSIISFARWNYNLIPATLKLEYAEARGFNSILNQGNASDPNYVNSILSSRSKGFLASMEWLLTEKFILTYKFDWLTPDGNYPIDTYQRHGFGFRSSMSPNVFITYRTEFAHATHPTENSKNGQLAQNSNFLLLEASF